MTDNRSPAFAPELGAEDVQAMNDPDGRLSRRSTAGSSGA